MRKIVLLICALGLISLTAGSAMAATRTVNASLTGLEFAATGYPEPPTTLDVQQFDPTWGTLTSISIAFNGTMDGIVQMEDLSRKSPVTVNMSVNNTLSVSDGSSTLWAPTNLHVARSYTLSVYDNTFDWGGTSGKTDTFNIVTGATAAVPIADLANYIGTSTVGLQVAAGTSVAGFNLANFAHYEYASMDIDADVTYTYTPKLNQPEPSSLALLGSGLLSMFGVAIRRRK